MNPMIQARVALQADYLNTMMLRIGVSPDKAAQEIGAAALAAAVKRCRACPSIGECDDFLSVDADVRNRQKPPEFCANAAFLAAIVDGEAR